MKRISRTVIAGCALAAIAAAIGSASARAESLQPADVLASAKDGGIANELAAKDGGKIELSAKDGGKIELSAKDGGKIELALGVESPAASKKDGGAAPLAAY
jgi:hypothetical protein